MHQFSPSSIATNKWRLYISVLGLISESSYSSIFDGNKVIADDAVDKVVSFNNVFVETSRIDGINRELPNMIIPTDIPVLEKIFILQNRMLPVNSLA